MVGAPALEREVFANLVGLTFAVFTLPQLVSLVIEAKLLLLAQRLARRRVLALALSAYGVGLAAAAFTSSRALFTAAWLVSFLASGIATGSAQAELMARDPEQRERRMTEWTIAAALGDLSVPLVLGAFVTLGPAPRWAWLLAAALFMTCALLSARRGARASGDEGGAEQDEAAPNTHHSLLALLKAVHHNRRLFAWLLAATLCSLLDEPLAAFAALWMQQRFGSALAASAGVTAFTVGGFGGLLILHRLLASSSPRTLLLLASFGAAAALVGWLSARSLLSASLCLGVLGAFAAAHYPLAAAAAYRALPDDSTAVAALNQLFGPLDLAIPLALGLLADHCGLQVAVAGLLLQPLALLLIAAFDAHKPASAQPK